MKIEIEIQNRGIKPGTCAWLLEVLQNSTLKIGKTTDGCTALFLKYSKYNSRYICSPAPHFEDCDIFQYDYETINGVNLQIRKVLSNENQDGLFLASLTPAAYLIAQEFVRKCCEKFAEFWENDSVDSYSLQINVIYEKKI